MTTKPNWVDCLGNPNVCPQLWVNPSCRGSDISEEVAKGWYRKSMEFSPSGTVNSMNKKLSASNHIRRKKYEVKLKVVQNVMYLHVTDSTSPPWMLQVSTENRKRKSKNGPSEHHALFIDALAAQHPRYKGKDSAKGLESRAGFSDSPFLWRWLCMLSSLWGRTRRSGAAAAWSEAGWRPTRMGRAL